MSVLACGIGQDIDLGAVDGTQQAAGIVMTRHLLADNLHHGCLSAVGDHLDGVEEMLALRALAVETRRLGQLGIGDVFVGGFALRLNFRSPDLMVISLSLTRDQFVDQAQLGPGE